jgi:nucleotide sugar dehydrogenase
VNLVIVGQGYVGLPLAYEASKAGFEVVGLDLDAERVTNLNAGRSHVDDLSDEDIRKMLELGYTASSDPKTIAAADVIVICVPTPLSDSGAPNLDAVVGATTAIAKNLRSGSLVVLESTTYPGTTEDLLLPLLRESGLELDRDFHLAFSPERIDPGNRSFGLKNTPKIVGGVTPSSTRAAYDFYSQFIDEVIVTRGVREAETAKLLENTYRHINIALVNEMARFCHELDIDLWDVIRAASTKPFGFQAFYPGPGVGGHCIPIDPNYLSYEVQRTLGYPFRFVELAAEINNAMPRYVVERTQDALNDVGKALRGSHVLLLGVTYKADIGDQRESPATPIASLLIDKGAIVSYNDPHVADWETEAGVLRSVEDLDSEVSGADIVILLQSHREYDVDSLAEKAQAFFDTRGKSSSPKAIRL